MAINGRDQKSTFFSTLSRDYSEQDRAIFDVYNHGERQNAVNSGGDFDMHRFGSTEGERSLLKRGLHGSFGGRRRKSQPCLEKKWSKALGLIISSLAKGYWSKVEGNHDVS